MNKEYTENIAKLICKHRYSDYEPCWECVYNIKDLKSFDKECLVKRYKGYLWWHCNFGAKEIIEYLKKEGALK